LAISVTDEGPGIPAADRARIWEPFWRGSGSAEGGTGLGLAIVRDLVSLHGGTITVDSAQPRGARFVATFAAPVTPLPDPAVHHERAGQPV
jgi:two-component system OmpR family sensor kinase